MCVQCVLGDTWVVTMHSAHIEAWRRVACSYPLVGLRYDDETGMYSSFIIASASASWIVTARPSCTVTTEMHRMMPIHWYQIEACLLVLNA